MTRSEWNVADAVIRRTFDLKKGGGLVHTISEDDYLEHYGRKGMKWYQHIFGGVKSGKRRVVRTIRNLNTTKYNFDIRDADAKKKVSDAFLAGKFGQAIKLEFTESYKISKLWVSDFVNTFKDIDIEYVGKKL